ncbi:radical SAM protein [Streptomyces sp. NBC_01591]|uniref:radical SAM/SPASM domain-containing protein n=1 Tax=Streptomyces sp. NBC_01591 TaxID=2975888 RepID=UPI002DD91FAF|nr:radical SAM protein [Streptomyces sp. NBC_01591]WSD71869.1 radical SAM protein [Streptomyces sp. NBC_01591]
MTDTLESAAPHATSSKEPFLFLYITHKCTLRCKHCYMGDRLDNEIRMSPAKVEEILSTLRVAYGQYKVYLLGGEPTTHPQFDEILTVCKEQGYKTVLTSNGLIPPKVWPHLDDRLDSFSFSMDGASRETHESMRGPNTWRPLLRSMERAIEAGFQTRAIYTITTANRAEVFDAIDLAERMGLEMLSFHYFTPTGLGKDKPHFQISPADWMKLCEEIRSYATGRRVRVFYPPAFATPEQLPQIQAQGYRGCTARNLERLAIFPDNRVYICSAFFDTDLHYGTFLNGAIVPRLPKGGSELTLVNKISDNCRICPQAAACGGGCAAYDHLERTLVSSECDGSTIPICPLWSMPAEVESTAHRLVDLR